MSAGELSLFYSFENAFIPPLSLKGIFATERILGWQFVFIWHFKYAISLYSGLQTFCWDVTGNLYFVSVYIVCFSPLDAFKIVFHLSKMDFFFLAILCRIPWIFLICKILPILSSDVGFTQFCLSFSKTLSIFDLLI